MHPSDERELYAGVDRDDAWCREMKRKIDLSAPERRRQNGRRSLHILNVGKAFGAQQIVGDILGCNADGAVLRNADDGCFQRPFLGK